MSCSTFSRISTFIIVLHKICEDYDNAVDHFPVLPDGESLDTLFKLTQRTKPEMWDAHRIHTSFDDLLEFIRGEVKNLCKEEMPSLWKQIKNLLKQFADVTDEPDVKKERDETFVKRQTKMKPMVAKRVSPIEYEVISDEEEDEEGEESVVIDDEKEDKKEHFVTPKLKRPRMQTPRAPRVVRRKIIFWKTVDEFVVPDDEDDKKQN